MFAFISFRELTLARAAVCLDDCQVVCGDCCVRGSLRSMCTVGVGVLGYALVCCGCPTTLLYPILCQGPGALAMCAPVGDCCMWEVEICALLWACRVVRLLFGVSQGVYQVFNHLAAYQSVSETGCADPVHPYC